MNTVPISLNLLDDFKLLYNPSNINNFILSKGLKLSYYNVFLDNGNITFGYNILHRSLIKLSSSLFNSLIVSGNSASSELEFTKYIDILLSAHILVSDSYNELSLIKSRYFDSLFSDSSANIVILPTLWCNFNCPYCFEYKKPIYMSKEIESSLCNWIFSKFINKKYLHVSWFGGEPLLAKEIIIRISEKIMEFVSDNHIIYSSSLTTNGYYLNSRFIKMLDRLNINNIQITLDGDEEYHNMYRKCRNGKSSFNTIIKNIERFYDVDHNCNMIIRVNCSDDNITTIPRLLDKISTPIRNKTKIFFRWLWSNEASGNKEFSLKNRGSEPFRILGDLYESAMNMGWIIANPNDNKKYGYCEADNKDYYQITPDGNIFLCSHTYKEENAIGNVGKVNNKNKMLQISEYVTKWLSLNPFEDPNCQECILLPICNGGCRMERFSNRKQCIEEKYSIEIYLKNIIKEIIMRKERRE